METKTPLRALIFGATGATGREIVFELMGNQRWTEVAVVARRMLDEWQPFLKDPKFNLILKDSMDELEDLNKWDLKKDHYSTLFSCFGSTRAQAGTKEKHLIIEYTYPLNAGKLGKALNIPHYSLVSVPNASPDSWIYESASKGKLELALRNDLKFDLVSSFRPGFITNRRNDKRLIETIFCNIPFIPKNDVRVMARAMIRDAELRVDAPSGKNFLAFEYSAIDKILKN